MSRRLLVFFVAVSVVLTGIGWGIWEFTRFWGAVDSLAAVPASQVIPHLKERRLDPRSVLTAASKNTNQAVRIKAVWALGELQDVRTVRALVASLSDRSAPVQECAQQALVKLGPSGVGPILDVIRNQSEVLNHERIAPILTQLGDSTITAALIDILDKGGAFSKETAARVLAEIGTGQANESLIRSLERDPPEVVRFAVMGLGRLADKGSVLPLTKLLRSEDVNMRGEAALALGKIKDPVAIRPLGDLLRSDSTLSVRISCIVAFDSLGSPEAGKELIALLKEGDPRIRKELVSALISCWGPEIAGSILSLTRAESREVVLVTAEILAGTVDSAVISALIELSGKNDPAIRSLAIQGLGRNPSVHALAVLRSFLDSKEMENRRNAIRALGIAKDSASVKRIGAMLISGQGSGFEETSLLLEAARALSAIGDLRAVPPLIEVIRQQTALPAIRYAAVTSLGDLRAAQAVPILITCLDEPPPRQVIHNVSQWDIRLAAISALSKIRDARSSDALVALVGSKEKELREAAVEELQGFDGSAIAGQVISLLRSDNKETTEGAHRVLRHLSGRDYGFDASKWQNWADSLTGS